MPNGMVGVRYSKFPTVRPKNVAGMAAVEGTTAVAWGDTVAVTSSSGCERCSAGGHAAIAEDPVLCPAAMFSVAGAIVIALGVLLASDTVTPPVPAA